MRLRKLLDTLIEILRAIDTYGTEVVEAEVLVQLLEDIYNAGQFNSDKTTDFLLNLALHTNFSDVETQVNYVNQYWLDISAHLN